MSDAAAPATRDLERMVAADLDEDQPHLRRAAEPTTMVQFMLRIDGTHELPLVVETPKGRVIARFARAGDLAIFVSKDRKTLPARFVQMLAGGQSAAPSPGHRTDQASP